MKKTLILLAGYPGTGKSYMANIIIKNFPELRLLSPDDIKEKFWDKYGFDTLEQKEELIVRAWNTYYDEMEQDFLHGKSLISDYPFSLKQKPTLEKLTKQYGYQVCTIRLIGQIEVLFERQKQRDLDDSRHLGHILTSYHRSDSKIERKNADNLLDYTEFYKRCTQRGYGEFKGGWEFPGGKIEQGETPEQALKREIMEELDTEIEVGELIDTIEYDYPNFHLSMQCFWCSVVKGDLVLKEHEASKWLTKDTLDTVKWLQADIGIVNTIKHSI